LDDIHLFNNTLTEQTIIDQTTNWIKSVVIGCNFCPFAAKAMQMKSIRYVVMPDVSIEEALEKLVEEMKFLDQTADIETSFLIFPDTYTDFDDYLDLVDLADTLLADQGYEGVYQLASFHPEYCFAGAKKTDPANFTNRSVFPMLHLLRESSITQAVENYPDPEGIPGRNVAFAQEKGLKYMQMLRSSCFEEPKR
jgi:uncharacterized protein